MRALFRLALVLLALLTAHAAGAQSLFERLVMPGPLAEAHARLETECDNCHESFRQGAQSSLCLDCHEKVAADVQAETGFHGRAAEVAANECSHCHSDHEGRDFTMVALDPMVFDHRLTDFTLDGAHALADCAGCHADTALHRDAPSDCIGCHRDDEPHAGRLGEACADCHQTTAWAQIKPFDHDATGFTLVGRHGEVACDTCHQNEVWKGLPDTCIGCHSIQDVHEGRFGAECDDCHRTTDWQQVRFDHDTDTDFALTGLHAEVACNACHTGPAEVVKLSTDCGDCHGKDDPHKGELGTACETCHTTGGWRQDVRFEHDITRFPLVGLHVLVPCEGCHVDATFHDANPDCAACHAADDAHKGALGTECAECHNPNGWAFWRFDHDTQTDFVLTGQHAGLVCEACHAPGSTAADQPATCIACHRDDDKHRGRYGTDCGACHGTESFESAGLQ